MFVNVIRVQLKADVCGAMGDEQYSEETALMMAAEKGHQECVSILVANGANVNAPCDAFETALMKAVGNGHLDCASILIANGADVNANGWVSACIVDGL